MIFFPALLWLIRLCKQKKLKANYLLYSQCSTVQEWLMIDQWLAVKATKFIIKKSTSCHWIQRMICVNLGFFFQRKDYMWWIFSVQDMRCIVLYIRIYTGKSLHFMCCSRVQWTELIMSIIFLYLYYEYFPQEYTLYSSVLHLRKFILKITHVLCHQCFKMQYLFFPFYYCYRSLLSSPPQKKML